MRIGDVAARSGVDARTLRFWEQQGLLPDPGRTPAGYRDYDPAAVARIEFIRQAQAAGLRLADIRLVLELRDSGQAPCEKVGGMLAGRLGQVDERIAELEALRRRLHSLLSRPEAPGSAAKAICPIIQAD